MADNPHFKELLQRFNETGAEYLIVGGYAVMKYTEPRFTKNLDVWVRNSPENALKVYNALDAFGAPLRHDGLTPEDFATDNITYQIGVPPVRIDILTHIDGVQFADAWHNRVGSTFFGLLVHFISLNDLANKQAVGRTSDLEHLDYLRKKQK